jgi:hypothetical protein
LSPRDIQRDVAAVAPQQHIGCTVSRLQTTQVQFVEKFREDRAIKADLARPPIESDAEARLN